VFRERQRSWSGGPAVPAGRPGRFSDKKQFHSRSSQFNLTFFTTLKIKELYREKFSAYWFTIEETDPAWQARYYAFNVFTEKKLEEKLDYMHLNPVRHGLVTRAVDWKWSSARWYMLRKPIGIPIRMPELQRRSSMRRRIRMARLLVAARPGRPAGTAGPPEYLPSRPEFISSGPLNHRRLAIVPR
jgi:hypothetical protein